MLVSSNVPERCATQGPSATGYKATELVTMYASDRLWVIPCILINAAKLPDITNILTYYNNYDFSTEPYRLRRTIEYIYNHRVYITIEYLTTELK